VCYSLASSHSSSAGCVACVRCAASLFRRIWVTNSSSATAKANGIAAVLDKSLTYMGIYVSLLVFRRAEQASRRLQQRGIMLRDAMDAVHQLRQYYADHLRSDEKWEEIWQHVISRSTELDLEMPQFQESGDRPINGSSQQLLQHRINFKTSKQSARLATLSWLTSWLPNSTAASTSLA